ncbi:MAG: TIM barrel protein [Iamia sp.]
MVELKVAGAPISWGVCEVPGWGELLPPSRVLSEMASLGLTACELGPTDYLPADPVALARILAQHGLRAVAGFVPLVLHDPRHADAALAQAAEFADRFAAAGAELLVSAAVVDAAWSPRRPLDAVGWRHLLEMLPRLDKLTERRGLRHVLHPHADTLIEDATDVDRVLAESEVDICLDTGHLSIGGVDPVELVERASGRVGHVHLKDVDLAVAARVRAGELGLQEAVRAGMFQSLGEGDVAIADVIERLVAHGYDGWYVLEQDIAIPAGEVPGAGEGPLAAVRQSLHHLQSLAAAEVGT